MKKISAVLLVLVLVGSVVFAGFTGSATTQFDFDIESGEYGFANATAVDIDMTFQEWLGAKKGEGDIYAEINAKGTLSFDSVTAQDGDLAVADLDVYLKVTSAKIIAKDWWVSILGSTGASDLAVSAIDIDGDGTKASLKPASHVTQNAKGVTVGLGDYTLSVGVTGDLNPAAHDFYGSIATPAFDVADGMTAKFAAAATLADAGNAAAGSAKVEYKADDYSASVAADLVYDAGFEADVAVSSAFGKTTVDAYFATTTDQGPAGPNYLEAKVATTVDKFTITASGTDLINTQALCLSAKMAASDELAVTGRGKYTINGGAWEAGADVVYTAADYTATLNFTYKSTNAIAVTAKAVSTTMIPGATLTAQYTTADIATDLGAVSAIAKIAF
jgi:hypothetical protein